MENNADQSERESMEKYGKEISEVKQKHLIDKPNYHSNIKKYNAPLRKQSIPAYSVFEGGGAKGVAFIGALIAAKDLGIKFIGEAGASAGAIAAYLIHIGCSPQELTEILSGGIKSILFEHDFQKVSRIQSAYNSTWHERIKKPIKSITAIRDCFTILWRAYWSFGVFDNARMKEILEGKAKEKLQLEKGFTFDELYKKTNKPLKIISSKVLAGEPVIYCHRTTPDESVVNAVINSASYPYLFKNKKSHEILLDGGISSNLPIFLFSKESQENKIPIIAFDLISKKSHKKRTHINIIKSIIDTAIESNNFVQQQTIKNCATITITSPNEIDTLSFAINPNAVRDVIKSSEDEVKKQISQLAFVKRLQSSNISTINKLYLHLTAPASSLQSLLHLICDEIDKGTNTPKKTQAWLYVKTYKNSLTCIAEHRANPKNYDFDLENPTTEGYDQVLAQKYNRDILIENERSTNISFSLKRPSNINIESNGIGVLSIRLPIKFSKPDEAADLIRLLIENWLVILAKTIDAN
ncbi:patatin-like phospholipase family protein [Chromobacterium phragmitis]|uniref:PNPLA domain-containing protein n=1 Tax=Chromobacterium phragmitis TaxID=2202141 RepID=A0A344UCY7_9NEIS|nr:patatin-like phospholipase family protein [Chromobacterium phragmitis]AXE33135.1 hypothetical protein DK843_01680 [Chromobacterium phragmitis]